MMFGRINWRPLLCGALLSSLAMPAFASFKVATASVAPTVVTRGQTIALSAAVQSSTVAKNVMVDLEVYNSAGAKVGQAIYPKQYFGAGQIAHYNWSYRLPTAASTGLYTFKLGVFTSAWSDLYWDNKVGSFSMSSSSGGGSTAVNGACGSANGQSVSAAPSGNLCAAGTASALAGSGPWTWSCAGSGGGTTASCSAPRAVSTPVSKGSNPCGQQLNDAAVIFCDTFDAPAGIGNRAGDLNGNVWGVSRLIGGGVNFGQHEYNQWNPTAIDECDGTRPTVMAPHDVIICNGQLREASNDNTSGIFDDGDVTTLAMYPKQPFDFAGRTGTVSFDVSNDTMGIHAAWPEFWMSDMPVPAPFNHFDSWQTLPANGFGVRFAAQAQIGQYGTCPNQNNLNKPRFTVDSAVVVRGYVLDDSNGYGQRSAMKVTPTDCVIVSNGPGQMNHIELRISQNQIDVYATDAGVAATPATLKHIAVISNANLTFTKGLIWLEDVHYNADKETLMLNLPPSTSQRQHTFAWDNVAFDGPFTARDFSYDALDNNAPGLNGSLNLGKFSAANQTSSWSVAGLPANPNPAAVRVLFNFNEEVGPNPSTLTLIVNGHSHSVPWPYPDQLVHTWRTFAVTIPVTDLVAGTNVVQLGADVAEVFSNVNIVLGDVPGGVPVLPGANDAYP